MFLILVQMVRKLANDLRATNLRIAHSNNAILLVVACLISCIQLHGQDKSMVQIKIFDQQLKPVSNLGISINGKEFIPVTGKSVFAEVLAQDLPPKSIKVDKEELEAESWNYSKGTLEVIVRKKNYRLVSVQIINQQAKPMPNLVVVYNGQKKITSTTNASGLIEMPMPLDEALNVERFSIQGYHALKISHADNKKILHIEALSASKPKSDNPVEKPNFLKNFSLDQLDSISSLTVFYSVFKNYEISKLDPSVREKIDAKFNQLVNNLQQKTNVKIISKISDSSFVNGDIKKLVEQARFENELLNNFRNDFDDKIKIINEKLANGASNLKPSERDMLLNDLNVLEDVLQQNENKFYKNISDYRNILSSLKTSFFDIQNLEKRLTVSESKRLEEQKEFRNKVIVFVSVTGVFILLIIMLVLQRYKLEKQRRNLTVANREIKDINDNLEKLVYERTRLLIDAHSEMDIFLYRSSHDLRAPICSIIGLCNLAVKSNVSDDLIGRIYHTAFKMDKLLNKLRFISEINQPSNYSLITLLDKIEFTKRQFGKFINENKIKFLVDCPESIKFYSYAHLVEIIIYHLVDNALFFSSIKLNNHPEVVISAKLQNDELVVSVYDNGIGIDENIRTRLWDMFFVGHELSHGNGLGLYIVTKSIKALNGRIELDSVVNEYTSFVITIPVNTKQTSSLGKAKPQLSIAESV
jgi:signal transduction histidine kinase